MFTGIIQGFGKVVKFAGNSVWIDLPFRRLQKGESICIDGVCLTVTQFQGRRAAFDVGPETRRVTTLGNLTAGRRVNLERALRHGDRLGGHWVSGHVEATARIKAVEQDVRNRWFVIEVPKTLQSYLIEKGSVAVDGISLTVASRTATSIRIMVIPHTLSHTTLGFKGPGDLVNLESDLLAKYAQAGRCPRCARLPVPPVRNLRQLKKYA
jgi:riboflavin synthase